MAQNSMSGKTFIPVFRLLAVFTAFLFLCGASARTSGPVILEGLGRLRVQADERESKVKSFISPEWIKRARQRRAR